MKFIDLIGNRYDLLTVVKYVGNGKWLLRCDCGNEVIRLSSNFKKKHKSSCGCISKNPGKKDAGIHRFYGDYKSSAKSRGYPFNLSFRAFKVLTSENCHYCSEPPSARYERWIVHSIKANGLDRIDNAKGYSWTNCVPCCKNCNRAKGTMTIDEFISWAKKLSKNLRRRHV